MTAISGAAHANAAAPSTGARARGAPAAGSLLPKPSLDLAGLGGLPDALAVLYADRVKQGELDVHSVDIRARQNQRASDAQQKKMLEAIAQQRAAERDSKGFWADLKKVASTVAKIATVVASAAVIVMSGGSGAPMVVAVASLVLSGGGMAVRELKLAGKDSDQIGMGMELAGAAVGVCGAVGGAMNAGAKAAEAAQATDSAVTAARTIKTGAQITGAAATATSATATVVIADYAKDAEMAAADAEEARGAMQQHQRDTSLLIETLKAAQEGQRDALSGTMNAIEACNKAAAVAIAGVRG